MPLPQSVAVKVGNCCANICISMWGRKSHDPEEKTLERNFRQNTTREHILGSIELDEVLRIKKIA